MLKEEGFDPTNKLRLGSSDDTTAHNRRSDGRVIFTDPCLMCGNKKRRLFTIEESASEPRRKKISIDPISIKHSENPPPSAPIPSPGPNSSLESRFRRCNTFPARSPASNNAPSMTPPGGFAQPDSFTSPESQANNVHNLGSSGGRSSQFFSSTQQNPSEEDSPATAPLPPLPTALLRSVSDLTPSPASRAHKSAPSGRVIGPTFLGATESPVEKRWKRMREGLKEMKNWMKSVEEDDPKDEYAPDNQGNDIVKKDISDIVESEVESEALPVIHSCFCGKKFQFLLSVRSI